MLDAAFAQTYIKIRVSDICLWVCYLLWLTHPCAFRTYHFQPWCIFVFSSRCSVDGWWLISSGWQGYYGCHMLKAGDFAGLETSWWFILCSAVCLCPSLWLSVNCSSGVVTGGAGGGHLHTRNFWLFKICWRILFLSRDFYPKMHNLGMKTLTLCKFMGIIGILSTHNLLSEN